MGEAKQLPRLAVAGPAWGARSKGSVLNYPNGNIVPVLVPMYAPKKHRMPGDIYRPASKSSSRQAPRPLGLIPSRENTDNLSRDYSGVLTPQPSNARQETTGINRGNAHVPFTKPGTAVPATRLKPLNVQYRTKSALTIGENVQSSTSKPTAIIHEEIDPDYMDILGRNDSPPSYLHYPDHPAANMYTHNLYCDDKTYQRRSVCLPIKFEKSKKLPAMLRRRSHSLRPCLDTADITTELVRHHAGQSVAQYIKFVEQASLNHRQFGMDKRDGLDYIPCERCRLRGGRCSNCKTIRIGGGYIILDGDGVDDNTGRTHLNTGPSGSLLGLMNTNQDGLNYSNAHLRASRNYSDGQVRHDEGMDSDGKYGNSNILNHGHYGNNREMQHASRTTLPAHNSSTDLSAGTAKRSSLSGSGLGGSVVDHKTNSNNMNKSGSLSTQDKADTGNNGSYDDDHDMTGGLDQGKDSHSRPGSRPGSRASSSRPVSSRPVSSRGRVGSGIGNRRSFERKGRKGISTSMEKSHGGRRQKKSGYDDSDESSDDDEARRRRRKKNSSPLPDIDENLHAKDKAKKKKQAKDIKLHGEYNGEDSDPEQRLKYRGSLYKFKSKEDNVKALKCTLKELQGIDPLDYLAKYCIIDPSKVPNYRRVYDNVDRDEDDEIDINELDFALKAVNYDLLSDAEVDYVKQILELSSRYKLNFHLFSVVAALSEKVVALEDMVKKLINKMDLKALETKMKKCKELFYLLDDMDSGEKDGVVTIGSLAVELQAGGLTEEHVEFVVDRLNHEKRGLVEFLDYLTYVPLFVEIHDSVCGNPLDFTRTK